MHTGRKYLIAGAAFSLLLLLSPPSSPTKPARSTARTICCGSMDASWIRTLFHQLGYDEGHFGTTSWNPLKGLVHPGDTVVLKP
ncbi:hypothetical protein, partial [Anaerotruncus colihominis]|uniref:hypothetical protein n=1 Tax=Anaerotruncus colihominis TaxID=169435 RepID=UPI00210BE4E6